MTVANLQRSRGRSDRKNFIYAPHFHRPGHDPDMHKTEMYTLYKDFVCYHIVGAPVTSDEP